MNIAERLALRLRWRERDLRHKPVHETRNTKGDTMAEAGKSKSGQARKSKAGRTALKNLRVSEKASKKISGGTPTAVERQFTKR